MKFEVTGFNTFKVMPQTRFRDAWTDGQGDSSITKTPPPPQLCGAIMNFGLVQLKKHLETHYFTEMKSPAEMAFLN